MSVGSVALEKRVVEGYDSVPKHSIGASLWNKKKVFVVLTEILPEVSVWVTLLDACGTSNLHKATVLAFSCGVRQIFSCSNALMT